MRTLRQTEHFAATMSTDSGSESDGWPSYEDVKPFLDGQQQPFTLSGIHEPLNTRTERFIRGYETRFADALTSWSARPLTKTERAMIALMGEITDKPA